MIIARAYFVIAVLLQFGAVSTFQQPCRDIKSQTYSHVTLCASSTVEDYDVVLITTESCATPVRKRITKEGSGDLPAPGSTVSIEYKGTLASYPDEEYWTPNDVVECWLSEQQGLQDLADAFVEQDVDSKKLLDPDIFQEDFVSASLGVFNKIQYKKLVMAAKRLAKERQEFQTADDLEFDSSKRLGKPYIFPLGKNKAIHAMDMAVGSMKLGEQCEIITRCDYAYGKEGLRTSKGDMRIPPFATLKFEIELVKIE
jgi:hypothetical protein